MQQRIRPSKSLTWVCLCFALLAPSVQAAPTQVNPVSTPATDTSLSSHPKAENILENDISHTHDPVSDPDKLNQIPQMTGGSDDQQRAVTTEPDNAEPTSVAMDATRQEKPYVATETTTMTPASVVKDATTMMAPFVATDATTKAETPVAMNSTGETMHETTHSPDINRFPITTSTAGDDTENNNDNNRPFDNTTPINNSIPRNPDSTTATTTSTSNSNNNQGDKSAPAATTTTNTATTTATVPEPAVLEDSAAVKSESLSIQVSETYYNWNDTVLEIFLGKVGDSIEVTWTFESNNTQVTGFEVNYRITDREDFDSSTLGKDVRSFTLHSLHSDENYVICVYALVHNTTVKDACADWSESAMRVVTGILAGVVFLVPCIIILIWILLKDSRMKKFYKTYEKISEPAGDDQVVNGDTKSQQNNGPVKGQGKTANSSSSTLSSQTKSSATLQMSLQGHDNQGHSTEDEVTPKKGSPSQKEAIKTQMASSSSSGAGSPAIQSPSTTIHASTTVGGVALLAVHHHPEVSEGNHQCTCTASNGDVPHCCSQDKSKETQVQIPYEPTNGSPESTRI